MIKNTNEVAESKKEPCPTFVNAKKCRELFGLSKPTLIKLVEAGEVRRKRTDESKNSGALYKVQDIYEWMTEESEWMTTGTKQGEIHAA